MQRQTITDWPEYLLQTKHAIEERLGITLNYAFVNIYDIPDDSDDVGTPH